MIISTKPNNMLFETSTEYFYLAIRKTITEDKKVIAINTTATPIIRIKNKAYIFDTEDEKMSTHREFYMDIATTNKQIIQHVWQELFLSMYSVRKNNDTNECIYNMPARTISVKYDDDGMPNVKVMYPNKDNLFELHDVKYDKTNRCFTAMKYNNEEADKYVKEIQLKCELTNPSVECYIVTCLSNNFICIGQWSKSCSAAIVTVHPLVKYNDKYCFINNGPIIYEAIGEYVPTIEAMSEFFKNAVSKNSLEYYSFSKNDNVTEHRWVYNGEPSVAIDACSVYGTTDKIFYECVDFREYGTRYSHDVCNLNAKVDNAFGLENNKNDLCILSNPITSNYTSMPRLIPFTEPKVN